MLFDAQTKLVGHGIIHPAEVDAFAEAWFVVGEPDHSVLSGQTQGAFDRAADLPDEKLDEFRDDLDRLVRFYSFLSQVVPYLTQDSEKLYAFSRFLALRLRERRVGGGLSVDVSLTHYRLTEVATHTIKLGDEEVEPGTAIGGDGTGRRGDIPMTLLGELVEHLQPALRRIPHRRRRGAPRPGADRPHRPRAIRHAAAAGGEQRVR